VPLCAVKIVGVAACHVGSWKNGFSSVGMPAPSKPTLFVSRSQGTGVLMLLLFANIILLLPLSLSLSGVSKPWGNDAFRVVRNVGKKLKDAATRCVCGRDSGTPLGSLQRSYRLPSWIWGWKQAQGKGDRPSPPIKNKEVEYLFG